ncbi:hypothetical protein [Egbenema bharatensis]
MSKYTQLDTVTEATILYISLISWRSQIKNKSLQTMLLEDLKAIT